MIVKEALGTKLSGLFLRSLQSLHKAEWYWDSTTYLTSGTLTSYNYSATINDVTFKDMYESKIKVQSGDSGGIMYTKNDGKYCALGITKCSNGTYSGFIKWNNIDDSFEIYFY